MSTSIKNAAVRKQLYINYAKYKKKAGMNKLFYFTGIATLIIKNYTFGLIIFIIVNRQEIWIKYLQKKF